MKMRAWQPGLATESDIWPSLCHRVRHGLLYEFSYLQNNDLTRRRRWWWLIQVERKTGARLPCTRQFLLSGPAPLVAMPVSQCSYGQPNQSSMVVVSSITNRRLSLGKVHHSVPAYYCFPHIHAAGVNEGVAVEPQRPGIERCCAHTAGVNEGLKK